MMMRVGEEVMSVRGERVGCDEDESGGRGDEGEGRESGL